MCYEVEKTRGVDHFITHINWAKEGGVLEECHSVIGIRVHDGRARKIENNEPRCSWLNMRKNKKLPQNGTMLSMMT